MCQLGRKHVEGDDSLRQKMFPAHAVSDKADMKSLATALFFHAFFTAQTIQYAPDLLLG